MSLRLACLALVLAGSASAQQQTALANGAILRALDKISGTSQDIEIPTGYVAKFGHLAITLTECRYPAGNPSGDAYAGLDIRDRNAAEPVFRGWMIASAPALSAMDHARYDVWVIRCTTS